MAYKIDGVNYERDKRRWTAYISVNNVSYYLISSESKAVCDQVRKAAERAKRNNTFNDFIVKLTKKREMLHM